MSNKGALATLNDDEVLDRIASGELMKQIAWQWGVAKQSLRERLMKHPRYHAAIAEQAESIVEDATLEMMTCPADMPVIARARARVDTAHKWAAARDPERWAPRREQGPSLSIQVVIQRDGAGTVICNGQSVEISADAAHQLPNASEDVS